MNAFNSKSMVHLEKLKQYYELSYLMYKNLAKIAKDMCFFTKNYKKKLNSLLNSI